MTADLNKTDLTLAVTEAAALWLSGIGCKPIETEVPVAAGWVADLAGAWVPTPTELQQSKIIRRRPQSPYPYSPANSIKHAAKVRAWRAETDPVVAALPHPLTVVLEVKTSRPDFLADDKWTRDRVANVQVLAATKGALDPEEVPASWWLLEHSAKTGKLLKVRRRGSVSLVGVVQRLETVLQIAIRSHNRSTYQRDRDLQKRHRANEAGRRTLTRMTTLARMLLAITRGEHASVQDCVDRFLGYHQTLPAYVVKEIEPLYGIQKASHV